MVSYILQTRQRLSADSSRKKGGGLVTKLCLTLVTPWTVAHQTPRSMGFSRQEYWSGLPFPPSGELPNPGTEPLSPALAGGVLYDRAPREAPFLPLGSLMLPIFWGNLFLYQ